MLRMNLYYWEKNSLWIYTHLVDHHFCFETFTLKTSLLSSCMKLVPCGTVELQWGQEWLQPEGNRKRPPRTSQGRCWGTPTPPAHSYKILIRNNTAFDEGWQQLRRYRGSMGRINTKGLTVPPQSLSTSIALHECEWEVIGVIGFAEIGSLPLEIVPKEAVRRHVSGHP